MAYPYRWPGGAERCAEEALATVTSQIHAQVGEDNTAAVNKGCHERGLITLTCGTYSNVFRFLPPLSIGDALLEEAFDVVAEAFAATA
jgi:4-aminobutyrate aminotransferase/(S)-3-amino-2-methylpropionate transaminase